MNDNMIDNTGQQGQRRIDKLHSRKIQPFKDKLYLIRVDMMFIAAGLAIAFLTSFFIPQSSTNELLIMLLNVVNKIPIPQICLLGLAIDLMGILLLTHFFLKKPKFDEKLVLEIAGQRLNTEHIYYTPKKLYLEYNRGVKEKDKFDLVDELSAKSDWYTYYYLESWPEEGVIEVSVVNKCPIPDKATIDTSKDKYWNIIPLGECVDNKKQRVSPMGWYLNDNNKNREMYNTIPSTSYLISGGTGSGKSVAEQVIVGHISRFPDNFQLVGVDCKRVEFNLLRGVKGVKGVALDVKTASDVAVAMRTIMMDRFKFMEDRKVNNIYKLPETTVDYYELHGKRYQFDEIFEVKINGETKIMTIDKIFNELENGKEVEFPDGI